MKALPAVIFPVMLVVALMITASCGGGGGGGSSASVNAAELAPQEEAPVGKIMSFEEDIEPIMQGKCLGCHNSGDNPLAPFSLEGIDHVNSFKSAIQYVLESSTMPPADAQQLTESEKGKMLAWLAGEPYTGGAEILRISLVEAAAWDVQPKNRDAFPDHRPAQVNCPRDTGWLVEDDAVEVRTEFCNYLSISQQALLDLEAGTNLELAISHSKLSFETPATAHLALSIGGHHIWETTVDIPGDSGILNENLVLPVAVHRGDPIEVHLHNHGSNTWTIHSLDALIPSDQNVTYCPTFDSTFEAIQSVVFAQAGCANSLCHGAAKQGGLDLTPLNAYDSLMNVASQGSTLSLVNPRNPSLSYLYQKLSAKTFPGSYSISGSPMPSAGAAISPGQLQAIRLWIEAGAPREGSVGDALGSGEDELERLLGVCLPEAEPVNVTPLPPPAPDEGVQFVMPPHAVPAEKEREICFAVYEDFRDVIPAEYLDETRDNFYAKGMEVREDAFTHHNVLYKSPATVDQIHDPSFGQWTCVGGEREGQVCEPTDRSACGSGGQCRSEIKDSTACIGYGPPGPGGNGNVLGLGFGIEKAGFYQDFPAHGIFYWNSHAFNLTTKDGVHHVWRNVKFADDRRFEAQRIDTTGSTFAAAGVPAFKKQDICRNYVLDQGDGVLSLTSHTHKRGERFFISIKGGAQIYESFDYEEPLDQYYEPALVFNSSDPAERTLRYCATYNNGVNSDGSPNIETVTRLSRRPSNAGACNPTACVAGKVGASCHGANDDASCDSAPGAGDGWCDACAITAGTSSDDEMFIMLGSKLANHDALIHADTDH